MKRIELMKNSGKGLYVTTQGALLAEFLGTATQGAELVAKFNQHAELVKALRGLTANANPLLTRPAQDPTGVALALLAQIDAGAA